MFFVTFKDTGPKLIPVFQTDLAGTLGKKERKLMPGNNATLFRFYVLKRVCMYLCVIMNLSDYRLMFLHVLFLFVLFL